MRNFDDYREIVNNTLADYLPRLPEFSSVLGESMRYSLEVGGKRLRPILLLSAYEFAAELADRTSSPHCIDLSDALPYAMAIEYIHTYSLIHDDLPAMDNDDLRRGKPTNHKVYGDDIAILAGDGLLNTAFEIMSSEVVKRSSDHEMMTRAARATHEIARRAGVCGMIGGQTADVTGENHSAGASLVRFIEEHKTADLIIAPIRAGLILGGASDDLMDAMTCYATNIGIAFQILDDILDYEGDAKLLGKNVGKDMELGKCNYASVHGIDKAHEELHRLTGDAIKSIDCFGDRADFFRFLANMLENRRA